MKILSLVRASMTEGMDIFKMKKSGKGAKIFAASVVFLAIFGWAMSVLASLRAINGEVMILSMAVAIASLLTFIEGVYKSGSLLFNCRDDDMLLSLPISRTKIVALRVFKFYVFELAFNSLILLPVILAFILTAPHGISFWLVSAVMVLFVPILPMALSCVIGALIAEFSSRFKKHNLISVILAFIFMLGAMYVSFSAGSFTDNIGEYAGGISGTINQVYYPARAYVEMTEQFNWIKFAAFFIIHFVVAFVAILFISKVYFRINSKVKTVRVNTKLEKIQTGAKIRKPFFALMKKELNRFFSSPVFVTNAGFGLVLFLVGVVLICIKFDDLGSLLNTMSDTEEEIAISLEEIRQYLPTATFVLVAFSSLMSFLTATMISLEGKALNLTKTLPISARKVLLAKIATALTIVYPPILVGIIAMAIRFQYGIIESMLLIVAGLALPAITELFGILVDLKHAQLDAENDAEVVKQSTSTTIATFFGLGGSLVAIGAMIALSFTIGQQLGLVAIDAALVVVLGLMYLRFRKICEERFSRLQS